MASQMQTEKISEFFVCFTSKELHDLKKKIPGVGEREWGGGGGGVLNSPTVVQLKLLK